MQPTRTQAIKAFLTYNTHADLAGLYNYNMEVQVNVAQGNGQRVDKTFKGRSYGSYTDGVTEWKPIRIPRKADTVPEYEDSPMTFDLTKHAEAIGMTGWDWVNKVSRWVAFDFDAIVGHSEKHLRKSTDEELEQIRKMVKGVPWVTIRYSTSGKGLHLYVFLPEVPTENHHEHAALARSVLGQLTASVGYDFSSKVDTCGQNMWVWGRKMAGTRGLELIKSGGVFEAIPPNWRDHIEVVRGDRRRTLPASVEKGEQELMFEELTGRATLAELDAEHLKHIDWLSNNGAFWYWDTDRNMLITHTWFLQNMHDDLDLKGIFKTNSLGTERGTDHNCFCFPLRRGAWGVRRFTPGVAEHPSWTQDGAGWTRCFLNREPDLRTLAATNGGVEKATGGFMFEDAKSGLETANALGANITLPTNLMERRTVLKQRKDGRLIMEIERRDTDHGDTMENWLVEKNKWQRVLSTKQRVPDEPEIGDHDELLRHLVTEQNEDAGWNLNIKNEWTLEPAVNLKMALKSLGHTAQDIELILGSCIMNRWKLTNIPFGPEYPGNRLWNKNAAQLLYKPTVDKDKDQLEYPTWMKIFNHLGKGLDEAVAENTWCKDNGILTGSDYLKCWVACLFQRPREQLPYLFFYSERQNTGKSTLHEALQMIMSYGAVKSADKALTSDQGFNGELATAILCVVEEIDLGKGKGASVAYNRIKDWVTAKMFTVHPKTKTPYSIPNTTHWIQCANSYHACPIFSGDTRITVIVVEPLSSDELVPKTILLESLRREAPDFLAGILSLEIPISNDRLSLPTIETQFKEQASRVNATQLEVFIMEETFPIDGKKIKFSEFCERFAKWVDNAEEMLKWSKNTIRKEIPPKYPYGTDRVNQRYIGNISWIPRDPTEPIMPPIKMVSGHLYQDGVRL